MRSTWDLRWLFIGLIVLPGRSVICPTLMRAQDNAVYNSTGGATTPSTAFIDAFAVMQAQSLPDICQTANYIFTHSYPSRGAVIDARGISGSALTCASGTTPWLKSGSYDNVPSTILLPAGTIITSVPWVLPTNTKLIGVAKGTNSSGNNYLSETTIEAQFHGGAVIQFGDSHCPSAGCQGISVEHLTIYGFGNIVNDIENDNCGLLCYADHVTMYQVLGTGLEVSGVNATDSGPYSNITFDVGRVAQTFDQRMNRLWVPHSFEHVLCERVGGGTKSAVSCDAVPERRS